MHFQTKITLKSNIVTLKHPFSYKKIKQQVPRLFMPVIWTYHF
jgi:hypothetical protein